MSNDQVLEVLLGGAIIGDLHEEPNGRSTFRFTSEYIEGEPRPVLSQSFLDDPSALYEGKLFALPSFFSNLLPDPDGKLRALVARQVGVKPNRELYLLAALGEDLPGAVVVRPRSTLKKPGATPLGDDRKQDREVRFSLAGLQLKFSMVRQGRRLMYPEGGRGGEVIVKLPDPEVPHVPENEYSMMRWAHACGIDVPEVELVPVKQLEGLPPVVPKDQDGLAFAVQRFDRTQGGGRIHIEDMAQVFGLMPDEKYEQRHYWQIGRLLMMLPEHQGFEQLVKRLVFMLASGNSDAHLKNWSLIYRDGIRAELAPAYDLVSTQAYERFRSDTFALELGRSRQYRDVSLATFYRFGKKAGADPDVVERSVREMVGRIRDEWARLRGDLPLPDAMKQAIEHHWRKVPLLGATSIPTGQTTLPITDLKTD
jgi:serine/threonine-protein kinase HipA